jgi:DNA-binding transcriptional regulator LsrR (DeoR family)
LPRKLGKTPAIGGKVAVLHGTLFAGFVNVLVTDEQTARGVLDRADGQ